jgi:hypothetical protein
MSPKAKKKGTRIVGLTTIMGEFIERNLDQEANKTFEFRRLLPLFIQRFPEYKEELSDGSHPNPADFLHTKWKHYARKKREREQNNTPVDAPVPSQTTSEVAFTGTTATMTSATMSVTAQTMGPIASPTETAEDLRICKLELLQVKGEIERVRLDSKTAMMCKVEDHHDDVQILRDGHNEEIRRLHEKWKVELETAKNLGTEAETRAKLAEHTLGETKTSLGEARQQVVDLTASHKKAMEDAKKEKQAVDETLGETQTSLGEARQQVVYLTASHKKAMEDATKEKQAVEETLGETQ